VGALRAENRVLSESLNELPEEATSFLASPACGPAGVWEDLAALTVLIAVGSIYFAWSTT
jgi:hypothetical protein